jgi:type IV pilus assembly protein PilA
MKKNKGFSLVELIIVIAIMAILAAAIAPALIRYIDKSRKADDIAAAETVNTAVQTSLSNEDAYDEIMSKMNGTILATANADAAFTAVGGTYTAFLQEVNSNLGGKAPKLKYKKTLETGGFIPAGWAIACSNGKPVVYITNGTATTAGNGMVEVQPSISKDYK